MKSLKTNVFVVALMMFSLLMPTIAKAATNWQDMTQGQFALWLVKAIGAQSKISAGAGEAEAIDFLRRLGVVPEDGWKEDEKITKKFLASLLGDAEAEKLSFEELVEKLRDHVENIFNNSQLGIFRAFGSGASASAVAG